MDALKMQNIPFRIQRRWLTALLVCSLALIQCGDSKKQNAIPQPDGDRTVMTFGSDTVTVRDFMIAFQESRKIEDVFVARAQNANLSENPLFNYIRGIAESAAFEKYLAEKARKVGMDQTDEYRVFTESVVKQELTQKILLEEILKKIQITEEDAKRIYNDNRDPKYLVDKTDAFQVRAIYIDWKSRSKEEAKSLAEQAFSELENGAPFDETAKQYSDAALQDKGKEFILLRSDLGDFAPEILSRLENFEDGQYSDVFEFRKRFYIYQRLKYIDPEFLPFSQVQFRIFDERTKELMNHGVFILKEELRQKHGCLTNPALISAGEENNPDAILMSVPGTVELTLGEFDRLARKANKLTQQDRFQHLVVLSHEALFLAEALSRKWTEKDVAVAVNYWQEKQLASVYRQSELEKKPIAEREILAVFEQDRDKPELQTKALYDLGHLFFPVVIDPSFSSYKTSIEFRKVEQQASKVIADMANGVSFDEAITVFSSDKTMADNCGYLGRVSLDSLDMQSSEAVEKLEVGEISQPVRIRNLLNDRSGYEIYYVRDIESSRPMTFEEARPVILSKLTREKRQQLQIRLKKEFDDAYPSSSNSDGLKAVADYLNYLSTRPDKLADLSRFEEF